MYLYTLDIQTPLSRHQETSRHIDTTGCTYTHLDIQTRLSRHLETSRHIGTTGCTYTHLDIQTRLSRHLETSRHIDTSGHLHTWLCARSWCTIKYDPFARLYLPLSPLIFEIEKRFFTCNTALQFCTPSIN